MRSLIAAFAVCVVVVFACQLQAGAVVSLDSLPNVSAPAADPVLPWRDKQEKKDNQIEKGLNDGLNSLLQGNRDILNEIRGLRNDQKAAPVAPPCPCPPVATPEPPKESLKDKIDDKKAEIKDALLESPFARHAAILVALVLVCLVGHAIYVKCHADKAKITAGLSALPVGGPVLASLFNKLDDFNTAVDAKVQAVKDQVKGVQDQVTSVALATPAPSQVAPAVAPATAK
jgi:hypothetical protein